MAWNFRKKIFGPRTSDFQIGFILLFSFANCSFFFPAGHSFQAPKITFSALVLFLFLHFKPKIRIRVSFSRMCLAAWPLVSVFWIKNSVDFISSLGCGILLGVIFASGIRFTVAEKQMLRMSLCFSGCLVAGYALLQWMNFDPLTLSDSGQPTSFFGNPNFSAHFLLLSFMLGKFPRRWISVSLKILILSAITLSACKTVWICLIVLAVYRMRTYRLVLAGTVLVSTALILFNENRMSRDVFQGLNYLNHPETYISAYKNQPNLIKDRQPWFRGKRFSLMTRIILFSNCAQGMVPEFKIFGAGMGQFRTYYPLYSSFVYEDINMTTQYRAASSHNLILDLFICFGIPYTLCLLYFLFRTAVGSRIRVYRAALLSQLFIAMFSVNFLNPVICLFLALFLSDQQDPAIHREKVDQKSHPSPLVQCGLRLKNMLTRTAHFTYRYRSPDHHRHIKAFWLLMFSLLMVVLFAVDIAYGLSENMAHPKRILPLFSFEKAGAYYRNGRYSEAAYTYYLAFLKDPYGPETLYNIGLSHIQEAEDLNDESFEIGIRAVLLCKQWFPYYSSPEIVLNQLKNQAGAGKRIFDIEQELDEPVVDHQFLSELLTEKYAGNF